MRQLIDHKVGILSIAILLALLKCLGCQSNCIQKAALIERDSSLTCSQVIENRCAIPSQFQDLADEAFQKRTDQDKHYVGILAIGEDALLTRIHLIRAARESIDLQTFIWEDDDVGQLLFLEMLQAARRGVKVRLILDQYGTDTPPDIIARMTTAHENIDIQLFRPVMNRGGKSFPNTLLTLFFHSDNLIKRMHNKLFVVDGRIGIVGGRNVEDAYYDYDGQICFKDMDLLVIGPEVANMARSFNKYWEHDLTKSALELPDIAAAALRYHADNDSVLFDEVELPELIALRDQADAYSIAAERPMIKLQVVGDVEYVADLPDKKNLSDKGHHWNSTQHVEELLLKAENEIIMETPYLIHNTEGSKILRALRKANPDLRIVFLTNSLGSADQVITYSSYVVQRQFLVGTAKAQVFELKPVPDDVEAMVPRYERAGKPRMILHAKFFVVDGRISFVGSHNFDPRSRNLNTENAVIIRDELFAASLKQIFERNTAPQNSWVVARRQKIPLLGHASEFVAGVSNHVPVFNVWPFDYSTCFELKEGFEPVPQGHPDFHVNHWVKGSFPRIEGSNRDLPVRIGKDFFKIFSWLM